MTDSFSRDDLADIVLSLLESYWPSREAIRNGSERYGFAWETFILKMSVKQGTCEPFGTSFARAKLCSNT